MSSRNENFAARVDAICQRQPARPALLHGPGAASSISYGELGVLVDGWAAALRDRGAGVDGSVAIWLPNSPAFVAAFHATLRVGGIAAPLGILLKPREIRARLEIAKPAVLVTTPALAGELGEVAPRVLSVDPTSAEVARADPTAPAAPRTTSRSSSSRRERPVRRRPPS
jgi:long-chain acyl-CoA synthetase